MTEENLPQIKTETLDSLLPKNEAIPQEWNMTAKGVEAINRAIAMTSTKHGLYASIPMVCKGEECPYAAVCPLLSEGMAPTGERCPLEIAKILRRYNEYTEELQIDETNIIDMSLIKDLIDIDIQIIRADNRMAIDGDFMQEVVVGISEQTGEAITNPDIHKAVTYKNNLLKKRQDILQLLNSTRKDKAGDKLTLTLDPSTYAAQLMQKAQEMNGRKIIDAD